MGRGGGEGEEERGRGRGRGRGEVEWEGGEGKLFVVGMEPLHWLLQVCHRKVRFWEKPENEINCHTVYGRFLTISFLCE